jgi:hypothetical protein
MSTKKILTGSTASSTSLVGSVADAVVPLPAELLILLVNVVV